VNDLIVAAIVIPVVTLASVAAVRAAGRWLRKAMHESFAEAVRNIRDTDESL